MRKLQFSFRKKLPKMAVAMALIMGCSIGTVYASTIDEAQDEKDEAEENENNAKDVLESLEEEQNALIDYVQQLDGQITSIQTEITKKEEEAEALQTEIDETQLKLADAQVAEDDQYAAMELRIQYLYENGEVEYIDTLLSSASFTDMLNKSEYVDQLSSYDQTQLNKLIETKQDIQDYEKTLEADLKDIESVKADLESQQDSLQTVLAEKEAEISKYDDDITAQEALLAKFTAKREEAEKKIATLQSAAISAGQGAGQTIYDSSAYSGKFMWPTTGWSVPTDEFGYRDQPTAGASTYHQGLDIGCEYGSDIVAAESGTVIISEYNASCGNYVMIDHGNGVCTVYMHNSQLLVGVGETVEKGQAIAKAGNTGVSTGTHCHFGVRINGTYVNPRDYL
ncbi:MAG: murein hydrolase activator EnvC family protein [Coprococcus sp.]